MNLVLLNIAFEVSGKLEAPYVRIYDLAGSSRPRPPDLQATVTLINSSQQLFAEYSLRTKQEDPSCHGGVLEYIIPHGVRKAVVRVEHGIQCPIQRSNGLERRSQWIPATTQRTRRSCLGGITSNGATRMLRRSQREKPKIFRQWQQINAIHKAQYNRHRHCYSGMDEKLTSRCRVADVAGTHARTQGIVKRTLVEKNLPTRLKQSMFAGEKEWPVLC
jgi:hypothetical protein